MAVGHVAGNVEGLSDDACGLISIDIGSTARPEVGLTRGLSLEDTNLTMGSINELSAMFIATLGATLLVSGEVLDGLSVGGDPLGDALGDTPLVEGMVELAAILAGP